MRFTVIGSGPSGVHFALTALKQGHRVEMLDVGWESPEPVNAGASFSDLKSHLKDPAEYFLGPKFEGVLFPHDGKEYYGIPPSKEYVFRSVQQMAYGSNGFSPLFSFARGGLAEVWTGGCYPFNDAELDSFPFDFTELEPYYVKVAERIGVNGVPDELSAYVPLHDGLAEPLRLDENSASLLAQYESQREYLKERLRCYMGRARHATLSRDAGPRLACQYLGRCLWGCPVGALYTPAATLKECMAFSLFRYVPGCYATHFQFNQSGLIKSVAVDAVDGTGGRMMPVENLVLAAGALNSSRIVLESVYRQTGKIVRLRGLMDNRQILVPFLNLRMLGRKHDPNSYQYNQLAFGLEDDSPSEYIHCLVTTLKSSMIHPIVQSLPFDLKASLTVFRNVRAALGLVNVNFHDTRRDENYLTLDISDDPKRPILRICYAPAESEGDRINRTLKRIKKVLWRLRCIVPPPMIHTRPMGASVHYAGTIPMSHNCKPWTVSADCVSHDFPNLFIADGATYPFLPAKNITFTLMANATRIAERAGLRR